MKNLGYTILNIAIIIVWLTSGCTKKEVSVQTSSSGYHVRFENHSKGKVFDPCKLVWGDYFDKKVDRFNDSFFRKANYVCNETLLPKGIIVDSFQFCHNKENDSEGWLTLYFEGEKQDIKVPRTKIKYWAMSRDNKSDAILFGHFNNDRLLDFRLHDRGSGTAGAMHDFYIYNPALKIFEKDNILSDCTSLCYNRKRNVYQEWGRGGGCNFLAERFVIKNGKKKIIKAIRVERDYVGGYSVLNRRYIVCNDTLTRIYDKELNGRCSNIYKVDKYCKEFLDFKLKYKL